MSSSPPDPGTTLRVFHLTTSGDVVAGAEQLLVGMARHAAATRWQLEFCTLTARDALRRESLHHALGERGCPAHSLDIRGVATVPAGLRRLGALLDAFQPDVLHTHLSHASVAGAIASLFHRRVLLVQTRHYGDYVARFRRRRLVADSWAARRCDHVIAVSEAAKAQLVDGEGVPAQRVTVVENGVEWSLLSELDRADGQRRLAELGVSSRCTIGCAATFNNHKGHTYLLQAMDLVRRRYPEACLVLLGTGTEESTTRAEVERLGLQRHVHFLGHRADGHALMSGLDLYVQPSINEGFGLAVIEAMAMRLPVVASAVGGMLKTVDPGRTGLLVPPADPRALADAMLTLIEDRSLAASLGAHASERVRSRYSLQRMMGEYDAVYRAALERRRRA